MTAPESSASARVGIVKPGRAWLPAALTAGMLLFVLSLSGGGSAVPPAEAQLSQHFEPEITITGFRGPVSGTTGTGRAQYAYEGAYEGVDLVVRYVPQQGRSDLVACGEHEETFRVNADGEPERRPPRASLPGRLTVAGSGAAALCAYDVVWPDVTGFGKPGSTRVDQNNLTHEVTYNHPSFFSQSADLWIGQTQELRDDVQEFFGNTPNNIMRYTATVRPRANSPAGCDANTKSLTETEFAISARADYSWGTAGYAATGDTPLIQRPHGASDDCVYDITFGDIVGVDGRWIGDRYIIDASYPDHQTEIRVGSHGAAVRFTVNPNPTPIPRTFEPQLTFNVAVVDYDNDGVHDYADEEFFAQFTPQSGFENRGCSPDETEFRYVIQRDIVPASGGQPARTQVALKADSTSALVDQSTDPAYRCLYDIVYSAGELNDRIGMDGPFSIWRQLQRSRNPVPQTDVFEVSGGAPDAEVTYHTASQWIRIDFAVDAPAAANDATFITRLESVPGSHRNCTSARDMAPTGSEVYGQQIVDWPQHHDSPDDRCEYTLTWRNTEENGSMFRRSSARTQTLGTSVFAQATLTNTPTMTAEYRSGTVMMTPEVSVDVPDVDLLGDGVSEFAGERFRVRFAPGASSASDVNCTAASEAVYEVGSDGDVSLVGPFTSGSLADVAAGSLSLVGWHADSMNECDYVATFLASASLEQDHSDPLANDVNLSWSDPRVSVPFDTSRRSVDSVFQVTGLGVPEGTPVTVEYRLAASAAAGCADARSSFSGGWTHAEGVWRSTLMVGSDNVKTLRNVTVWPKGWRTATDECLWMVSWPDQDDGQAYRRVPVPVGSQAEFADERLGDPPRFKLRYRAYYQRPTTYFTPSVAVSVPYEAAGGVNRYAGETITLRYARVSGASNECTASATETYVIGDGGTAATGGVTALTGAAARLVDEPEVTTPGTLSRACEYQVSAPARSSTASGSAGALGRIGGATIQFNADGLLPSGGALNFSYESVFTAVIDISVPDDDRNQLGDAGFQDGDSLYKGTTFGVTISKTSGPAAGCTADLTLLFVVDDQGDVNPASSVSDDRLVFVDRVPGAANPCEYTVTFPPTVGRASTTEAINYQLTGGGTATISASNRRATASYTLLDGSLLHRRFVPDIDITVPGAGPSGNQYEGGQFEVTFTRHSAPPTGCADAAFTYVVTSHGDTIISDSATAGAPFLVNRLNLADTPCVYTTTFPQTIQSPTGTSPTWELHLQETTTATVSFTSGEITRTYATTPPGNTGSGGNQPNTGGDNPGGNTGNTNTGNTNTGNTNTGNTNTGNTNTGNTNTGNRMPSGGNRRPSGGGGGGGGGSRSGGGSSGGAATGPWVVSTTSRVPVSVSLAVPADASIPAGTAIEIMLNVPDTCGEDVDLFGGMPASIGLVYAIAAQPGATADVLAASALQLANHATRGDQTRGCELRVTLITAPDGCTLSGADTDEAGRPYVDLAGSTDLDRYSLTPSLACT